MAYCHAAITVVQVRERKREREEKKERKFLGNWREKRSEDAARTDGREEQLEARTKRPKSRKAWNDQG